MHCNVISTLSAQGDLTLSAQRYLANLCASCLRAFCVESEKARISSVIHNRLNLGMIPEEEFPEIPLCSPGKSSIEAALYPSEDENIYYALSDKLDGTHVFTSDENEYNTFVEAYNKARSERDELIKQKKTAREASEDGQKAEDGSETENDDSAGTEG